MGVQPFEVRIPQETLDDLRERLARTRWTDEVEGASWDYGTVEVPTGFAVSPRDIVPAPREWTELREGLEQAAVVRPMAGPRYPTARRLDPRDSAHVRRLADAVPGVAAVVEEAMQSHAEIV